MRLMAKPIEYIAIDNIRPNPYNPNVMSADLFDALVNDIERYGIVKPIRVFKEGPQEYVIIDGEQRWRACKAVSIDKVPVIVEDLSEFERKIMTINLDAVRSNLDIFELGKVFEKLREKYSEQEMRERLAYSSEDIEKIETITGQDVPDDDISDDLPDEEQMHEIQIKMTQDELDTVQRTLQKFTGSNNREKLISMIMLYDVDNA